MGLPKLCGHNPAWSLFIMTMTQVDQRWKPRFVSISGILIKTFGLLILHATEMFVMLENKFGYPLFRYKKTFYLIITMANKENNENN